MPDYDYDLFVIGAGSGGTRAARVASAHGAKVAVAEEYRVGGTCVIRGCVPKKLLVYGAHFAEDLKDAKRFGWNVPAPCDFDWSVLRDNVMEEVDRINQAYTQTLEGAGAEIIHSRATITGPHSVEAGGRRHQDRKDHPDRGRRASRRCRRAPVTNTASPRTRRSTSPAIPKRILIAGAGYIANEFAGIFHQFGAHVTLINRTKDILRGYDLSIRDRLLQISLMKGLEFKFDAGFEGIEKTGEGCFKVSMSGHDPVTVDLVMFATGRVPNTKGLGLDSAGVDLNDKGAVVVDADNKSTCDSIYAIGDVTDRIQLTPIAIREGQAFAENMYGSGNVRVDYENVPSAVFSHPPLAGVGMTEAQARQKLGSVKVYSSDFRPMKNVLANRDERALYKMVCDGETDRVVGIHMIGPDVPEIIQAAAVAVKAGLTKKQFDETVALHPTMAEELVLLK